MWPSRDNTNKPEEEAGHLVREPAGQQGWDSAGLPYRGILKQPKVCYREGCGQGNR